MPPVLIAWGHGLAWQLAVSLAVHPELGCRHLAASEGAYQVTEWLLTQRVDVNSLDRFKRTPLEVRDGRRVAHAGQQAAVTNAHLLSTVASCAAVPPHVARTGRGARRVSRGGQAADRQRRQGV